MAADYYKTPIAPADTILRERGSKFMAYLWPVRDPQEAQQHIDALWKMHPKASHVCYAWRLDPDGLNYRANDDGEPAGTAGKPILNQILSAGLSYVLVAVVRYFGGTPLGTSGLIQAYGQSAADVLALALTTNRFLTHRYTVAFDYALQPALSRAIYKNPDIFIITENYSDTGGQYEFEIRQSMVSDVLLKFKADWLDTTTDQAATLGFPLAVEQKGDGDRLMHPAT
jgi:uncharacterized YigZ family protein